MLAFEMAHRGFALRSEAVYAPVRLRTVLGQNDILPWRLPPKTLILLRNEVHVWRAALNRPGGQERGLGQTLSDDEHERAAGFRFQRDRERFIAARGMLRVILGSYLKMEPRTLQFCYGPHGKPALASQCGVDALCFNSSHSHELFLCAVTRGRDIGVDLEHVRGGMNVEEISERFFSPPEIATLRSVPPERKQKAFFACWTRKEAYIKAKGDGLALPLDSFSVSCSPGEPEARLSVQGHPEETSRWSLWELNPDPSYVAALAVEGRNQRVRCWELRDELA